MEIRGIEPLNKHLGIPIKFNKVGKSELAYGRAIYKKKVIVLMNLPKLVEIAEYNNFGMRKESDPQSFLGYVNFKVAAYIDGVKENIRITYILQKDGSLYYNHEINIIKGKSNK